MVDVLATRTDFEYNERSKFTCQLVRACVSFPIGNPVISNVCVGGDHLIHHDITGVTCPCASGWNPSLCELGGSAHLFHVSPRVCIYVLVGA